MSNLKVKIHVRLHNFPLDIQELSITLSSKLGKNQIKLIPNPKRFSSIDNDASGTFIDQQKWYLIIII